MLFTNDPYPYPRNINTTWMRTHNFISLYNRELTNKFFRIVPLKEFIKKTLDPNYKETFVKFPDTPTIRRIVWEKIGQSPGDERYNLYITAFPEIHESLKQVSGVLHFEPDEDHTIVEMIIMDERLQSFWEDLKDFYRISTGGGRDTLRRAGSNEAEQAGGNLPAQDFSHYQNFLMEKYPREWATALDVLSICNNSPDLQRQEQAKKVQLDTKTFEQWITKLSKAGLPIKKRRRT